MKSSFALCSPESGANRQISLARQLEQAQFEQLESRELLTGYIQANSEGPFYPLNTTTYAVAAPGVLSVSVAA